MKNEEAKNEFESLIYEFRDWINDYVNEEYIAEFDREYHNTRLSEESEWLDDEGDEAGYEAYQKRSYDLSIHYTTFKKRKEQFKER